MKAFQMIGTGALVAALAPDLSSLKAKLPFSQLQSEGQSFEVNLQRHGKKIAIAVCSIGLIGGVIYTIWKYFKQDEPEPPVAFELPVKVQVNQEDWQVSSISTNQARETYQELKCGITSQLMVDPVSLPCSHEFSRKSVQIWLQKDSSCPQCRSPATAAEIRTAAVTARMIERYKKKLIRKGKQWAIKRINLEFEREILK